MPEPVLDVRLAARPAAVLAALTARLHAQGDLLSGIDGFGSIVTWQAFDRDLELVTLRAEITSDLAFPGITRMTVQRVDPALEAALRTCAPWAAPQGRSQGRPAGEDRATG